MGLAVVGKHNGRQHQLTGRQRPEPREHALLQRDGGLSPALSAVALASGQAALQLVWQPLIAVPAHRPQVNLNKLISGLVRPSAPWERTEWRKWGRRRRRRRHQTAVSTKT